MIYEKKNEEYSYSVNCDYCGNFWMAIDGNPVQSRNKKFLIRAIELAGWKYNADKWKCPKCQKKIEENE